MPGTPALDPEYRIAAGKDVYRIEKRAGGKWSTVATFAVSAATCKSSEPKEAAPPEAAPGSAEPKKPQ